jgi:imidazolonepropionase-like amidohydrolase
VEVGKAADLILVNGNPLKDVGNVANRAGVMLRGRWLPEEELARMLDAIAAGYKTTGQQ